MKPPTVSPPAARSLSLVTLLAIGVLLLAALVVPFFSSSLAFSSGPVAKALQTEFGKVTRNRNELISKEVFVRNSANINRLPLLMPQAQPTESIATYIHPGCTAASSSFLTGQTVCVKADSSFPEPLSIYWVNPDGAVVQVDPITSTNPEGTRQVNAKGNWRAYLVSRADGSARYVISFTVSDPLVPAVDLAIFKGSTMGTATAGGVISYHITVKNYGPDTAGTVQLSDPVPANAAYLESSQDSGPLFTRDAETPTTTWSIASLPAGASATFTFTYTVTGAAGSTINNTVNVSSATDEQFPNDNTWTSSDVISSGGAGATCSLDCPNDIVTTATTHGAGGGADVTFAAPEAFGSCGTVTSSPASGTFFPIGTTTVTNTSSTGSGFCSFTVTVIDSPAPTISCPANIGPVAANSGEGQAYVPDPSQSSSNVGAPTITGNNIVVTGSREDGEALTASYPIGSTTITWTVTEYSTDPETDPEAQPTGRSANCEQTITVTGGSTLTITCPADQTAASPNGCDPATVNPGTATSSSGSATILGRRSDNLAYTNQAGFNDPYPVGVTDIVWTATGTDNQSASCTQTITVTGTDTTPPTLTVPPNVSATTSSCTATLDDELGVASAEDDCGTVSISRSGVPTFTCPTPQNPNQQCESFVFPTGTTIITYTATNSAGLTTTGTQQVTVTEDPAIPPTVTAPADVSVNTGAAATTCGAQVDDATLGSATANDNCPGVTVARTGVPAGNNFPVGNTTVTYTATDASGSTAIDTQIVTVVDNTVPTINAPADVTLYTGPGATSCGVTVTNLDATLGTATTSDNCPGPITVARGNVPAGNSFPVGETIVSYVATDSNNNNSVSVTQKVTVVDNTAPVVTPPADITVQLPSNSTANSMVVNYPNPATATDNCPGTITFNYSPASGSTFPVGPTTVTVTATDAHNNSASATFTVTVLYNFTGFFSPVNNLPTINNVNAGRSIPLKFSLSGNKGLGIFAVDYPASQQVACNSSAPLSDLEGTDTPGGSTLTYSPDQYHYNWKTEGSWAGTCRQLVVKLNDGSSYTAMFKFK
ncbi:MAG: PxKF domain-containing protein [Pyrinomonadaceae bacterium]|nr:PxKF domain-containing protein [Pyrinomonadaceae bacterium]